MRLLNWIWRQHKPHKHHTLVTHLAMDRAALEAIKPPRPWGADISFNREPTIAIADYRALYDSVGRAWHWVNRREIDDKSLAAIIHHPRTDIFVLRHRNTEIGFIEIHRHQHPMVEIIFVGLLQEAIGQGFGQQMLHHALYHLAQAKIKTKRVIMQTCTLDHPSALPLYIKMGFRKTHTQRTIILDDY
ncbi:MAG: GNAT family N-acetyltransferase [Alphaproteobacteria bacterium]|nr:GNAT family N-acetyltransferase [Alphaproteobacteria bacterium]MBE8220064.1 GNAT family N-acetyltransferase [Alphaproteobacteria bacterium]